jgi:serine/threonine protein phosphatase PrpC
LTRYANQAEIAQLITAKDLTLSCQRLINIAKERGGADNITVILLHAVPA